MNDRRELHAFVALATLAGVILLCLWFRRNARSLAAKIAPKQVQNMNATPESAPSRMGAMADIPNASEDWVTH